MLFQVFYRLSEVWTTVRVFALFTCINYRQCLANNYSTVRFQGIGKALIMFFKEVNDVKSIQEFHFGHVCGT